MANIGDDSPRTICKGNLMECKLIIHKTSTTNGPKKNRGREKLIKREGPRVKGIVKTQLEVVEVENASLCPHI